jgi:imidazolonepropionase-like amidohydrolase
VRGYRADIAFDGARRLPGGALVLVEDGVIVGVESASFPAPEDCPVTDGAALLPGLIDTHVHLCGDSSPRALDQFAELSPDQLQAVITTAEEQHLRAGVTTVRDLGDHWWAVVERSRTRGDGPTVVASGPPLTVPGGHCASMGGVATGPEALRAAVRERVQRGAGVVKIMASGGVLTPDTDLLACQFTLDEMRAVVDEAHQHGLPVTAHAHGLPSVERAVESGVDGIEHCSCLTREGARLPRALVERLVDSGVVVCPTVGRVPGVDPPPHVQARLAAIGWTFEDHLAHVAELQKAGVTFLAGTDAGIGPSKRHGLVPMAVVDLVACGAPVTEALASATRLAARAIGLQGRTGRLAVGLDADLLLVDGDPLSDVTALQRPRTVVSRGRDVPLPSE